MRQFTKQKTQMTKPEIVQRMFSPVSNYSIYFIYLIFFVKDYKIKLNYTKTININF